MYCPNCGAEISDDYEFCPKCGIEIKHKKPAFTFSSDDNTPQFILKPVFVPSVTLISILPRTIFFTIWGALFFGIPASMIAAPLISPPIHTRQGIIHDPIYGMIIFPIIFGILFLIGIPIANYILKKKKYKKTEYRFFKNKLEYYEGFFTVEQKVIRYKDIREVYLKKGILQSKYNLGTIILMTNVIGIATSTSNYATKGGIKLEDIKNPDEAYQKIKELVGI